MTALTGNGELRRLREESGKGYDSQTKEEKPATTNRVEQ